MDHFNTLSTAAAARNIPLLKEASPAKVMSCALIASTGLRKDLDVAKEVTGRASTPSAKMVGRLANSPSWLAVFCGQSAPVMRVDHHQRAKVIPVPEVVEHSRLMLFPLIR
jgi:hypothetical protein